MKELDIAYRTMFAELLQRSLDATFETDFPVEGRFVEVAVGGRKYWYFDSPIDGKNRRAYVGPKDDPEITSRVEKFRTLKSDFRARRKLVSTLIREAGLPAPERFSGDVVETLARAGFFRLRGVLIGTVAFQTYAALLGVRLPAAAMQTSDVDFAQFHSISATVGDSMPPMLETLRRLDGSFREIPDLDGGPRSSAFINEARYKVEFLTPNRGRADFEGHAADMPALGGAAAQPLRFLDYLIYEPVRSILLHKAGISVLVPAPERYAIHKLIVAARRRDDDTGSAKRSKDVVQADKLIEAMALTRRQSDLAFAFAEAWTRGPAWRSAITVGLSYLPARRKDEIAQTLLEGLKDNGQTLPHLPFGNAGSA